MPSLRSASPTLALLVLLLLTVTAHAAARDPSPSPAPANAAPRPGGDPLAGADLDGDGTLTLADLKLLGRDLNTLAAAWRGDVDGDGRVTSRDVIALARVLVSAALPERKVSEDELKALVQFVADDGAAAAPEDPREPPEARELRRRGAQLAAVIRKYGRGLPKKALTKAIQSVRQEASTSARPAVIPRDLLAGTVEESGRPPEFPPELRKFSALLQARPPDRHPAAAPSFAEIGAARDRLLGAPADNLSTEDAFTRMVGKPLTAFPLSECPDPALIGGSAAAASAAAPLIRASSGGKADRLLPRGRFQLVFNPDDPFNVKIKDKRGGAAPPPPSRSTPNTARSRPRGGPIPPPSSASTPR